MATKTPVQLFIFIKKREDLSREEFKHYTRDVHGSKFLQYPSVRKHCIKYEQVGLLSSGSRCHL